MNIEFNNKTVFLTGGSRGIGKAIKALFLSSGAEVIAPPREELDLSSPESISCYLKHDNFPKPDIFIHCAGVNKLAGIDDINMETMEEVFQVNCFAPTILLHSFTQHMKEQGWGRIIFISSLYGIVSKEQRIAYSSSKNALNGLCKTLALELAPYNILVNSIAPGYVMTDMTKKNLADKEIEKIKCVIPTGRFQSEKEIAYFTAFLSSVFNQSVTGQIIAVDGGFICR